MDSSSSSSSTTLFRSKNRRRGGGQHGSIIISTRRSVIDNVVVAPFVALLLLVLATSTSIRTVNGQTTWSGCIYESESPSITIGQLTTVCLQIGNELDWGSGASYIRVNFQPVADEYSRFHIPFSYRDLVVDNTDNFFNDKNITVGSASQQALSYLRLYYDVTNKKIYPFLTAIIDVKDGIVRAITWDNACVFCGGFADRCEENTYDFDGIPQDQETIGQPTKSCFFTEEQCDDIELSSTNSTVHPCDLMLYTVWSGTDATGNAFQSQAYRFSLFPPQQISDRITQLIPTFGFKADDIVPDVFGGDNSTNSTDNNTRRDRALLGSTSTSELVIRGDGVSVGEDVTTLTEESGYYPDIPEVVTLTMRGETTTTTTKSATGNTNNHHQQP